MGVSIACATTKRKFIDCPSSLNQNCQPQDTYGNDAKSLSKEFKGFFEACGIVWLLLYFDHMEIVPQETISFLELCDKQFKDRP